MMEALEEVMAGAGRLFDPKLVAQFHKMMSSSAGATPLVPDAADE